MSIIISKEGQSAQKIDKADFEKEDYLQNYIHENPESIPVYEIQEDKRLFVIAREFPTESGPIDALAVDKDGDIYVVETKLYKNPDKRTVVAQALDYGASMWKHLNDFDEFIHILDDEVQNKFKMSLEDKLKNFFSLDGEQSRLVLDAMRMNLREGKIKFVILMDSMDERLKDLIIYVNQNSQFDIYAVQLEYYKFQEYEIMIPKIFGVEVKKNLGQGSAGIRIKWTREKLLEEVAKIGNKEVREAVAELLNFSEKNADSIALGTGKGGSFAFKSKLPNSVSGIVTLFIVYLDGDDSALQISTGNVSAGAGEVVAKRYCSALSKFEFMKNWNQEEMIIGYSPSIYIKEIFKDKDWLKPFEKAILKFMKEVKGEGLD